MCTTESLAERDALAEHVSLFRSWSVQEEMHLHCVSLCVHIMYRQINLVLVMIRVSGSNNLFFLQQSPVFIEC